MFYFRGCLSCGSTKENEKADCEIGYRNKEKKKEAGGKKLLKEKEKKMVM